MVFAAPKYDLEKDESRILGQDKEGAYRLKFWVLNTISVNISSGMMDAKNGGMVIGADEYADELEHLVRSGIMRESIREMFGVINEANKARGIKP